MTALDLMTNDEARRHIQVADPGRMWNVQHNVSTEPTRACRYCWQVMGTGSERLRILQPTSPVVLLSLITCWKRSEPLTVVSNQ